MYFFDGFFLKNQIYSLLLMKTVGLVAKNGMK